MKCPTCGMCEMVLATRDVEFDYKEHRLVISAVHAEFCDNCGEVVYRGPESDRVSIEELVFEKRIDALLAEQRAA